MAIISQCDHHMIIVAFDDMIRDNSNLIEPRWNVMEIMKLLLILFYCFGTQATNRNKTNVNIRPTSHTRLRARDHYNSSTLVGGKGGAGPSLLHTLQFNGVCEHKMDVKSTWISPWHQMNHVSWSLGLFLKTISWR